VGGTVGRPLRTGGRSEKVSLSRHGAPVRPTAGGADAVEGGASRHRTQVSRSLSRGGRPCRPCGPPGTTAVGAYNAVQPLRARVLRPTRGQGLVHRYLS